MRGPLLGLAVQLLCFQIEEVGLLGLGEDIPSALARVLCEEALEAGGDKKAKGEGSLSGIFLMRTPCSCLASNVT